MERIQNPEQLRKLLRGYQKQGLAIGFVPTMGALHEGHLSLARRSKKENALTVMSIFVNSKQFGPDEDFSHYPRDLEADALLAESARVDTLFAPRMEDMYPEGFSTYVEETEISKGLCGPFRPGHFRGVCTAVYRLFRIVGPDRAYFGRKDGQQLRVIEKMAEDLDLGIQIIGCPTVRESDGLAMSSRNAYLLEDERVVAPQLYTALRSAADAFGSGERIAQRLTSITRDHLAEHSKFNVQYVELRRWRDFADVERVEETSILAVAAFLGRTRLIDNVLLVP